MRHTHTVHDNPFFNRHRITDPAFFCGRAREVEALYSAIATRQCRAVVGERKLGKSSLLTHLSCPAALRRHGFDPDAYLLLYLDLEGMANISYDEFWPELLDRLELALPATQVDLRALTQQTAVQPEVRFMQVRRLLRRVERAGLTVVILLDEFESLAANAHFGPGFYGELRSLAGELGVVYITASKRGLYDLTYQRADALSSPFFNIFSEETLGLLPLAEAAALLRTLSALPAGEAFTPEQIEYLLELAGPHPFFLQAAGWHLFNARRMDLAAGEALRQVARRFATEAEDHFRYWQQQLAPPEQALLQHLDTAVANSTILKQLVAKALLRRRVDGGWQPFSRAFADFLARTDPLQKPLREPAPGENAHSETGDLTGATLGNYRVLSPVGRGGMAVVYKGYQPALDRYVAIKVMGHAVAEDKTFLERFQREAAAVARLRHQNLVQMLDFGVQGDLSYMVMEYIDGETLKERLTRVHAQGARLPLPEVARIIGDMAAALDYAHAYGIVHRDVKPANIMLRREERLAQLTGAIPFTAVLTDFGVARMLEGVQLTGDGAAIGTPDYMAPEQAQGQPATAAADIYALGVVLYEMLTGALPFTADSPLAVLLKHMQSQPPRLRSVAPELPPDLEFVLMRALAKAPTARFATAGELAAALAQALEGRA